MSEGDVERQYFQIIDYLWDQEEWDMETRALLGLKETDKLPEISPRGKSFVDKIMKAVRVNNET